MSQRKYKVKGGYRWIYEIIQREKNGEVKRFSEGKFRTKTEAKAAEAEMRKFLKERKGNIKSKEELITLDEMFHQSIQERRDKGVREQSIKSYTGLYNKWYRDSLGNVAIRDITKEMLQDLVDEMASQLTTMESQLILLKSIFKYSLKEGIVDRSVAEGIIVKKYLLKEKKKTRDEFLLAENLKGYFDDLSKYLKEGKSYIYERDILMYHLLLATGLRVGEAMSLRWTDIDFDNKIFKIHKTQVIIENKIVDGLPKTGELRDIVVLNDRLYFMLNKWKKKQEQLIKVRGKELDKDLKELIFFDLANLERLKTVFYTETLYKFYKKYPQAQQITSHGFRHTLTTHLRSLGYDKEKVARYIGHEVSNAMTDHYTHLNLPIFFKETAELIDKELQKIFE